MCIGYAVIATWRAKQKYTPTIAIDDFVRVGEGIKIWAPEHRDRLPSLWRLSH